MRWERLFADLEQMTVEDELAERDALVNDLREGDEAATSWRDLAGGHVTLEVAGLGRIDGEVMPGNNAVMHIQSAHTHVLISPTSVLAVLRATARSRPRSTVADRLGWPSVLRMLHRDQERVQVFCTGPTATGSTIRSGTIDQVGADFFGLRDEAASTVIIPLTAVAAISCPR